MAKVKALAAEWLRFLQENLDTALASVPDAQAKARRKLQDISTAAYAQKYKPDALAEMRRAQREQHTRSVLNVIKNLVEQNRIVDRQREYREVYFWRGAPLCAPPPEIKIGDSAGFLRSKREVQTLAQLMAFSSHAQMESTGRQLDRRKECRSALHRSAQRPI